MQKVKKFWDSYKNQIIGISLIGLALGWAYSADSTLSVPKADKLSANANIAVQESENRVESADEISARAEALEIPKKEAIKIAKKSAVKFDEKKQKFDKEIRSYENFQKTPVVITADDLDQRELDLLSGLRELYPDRK